MAKIELKSALISLGVTEQETEVYLALAELGACTSGPIIEKTGLHRNVVYTALEHLIARKFVLESQVKGKKQFVVADPTVISTEFSQKAEIARDVALGIQTLAKRQRQEISVHEGNEEYLALLARLIRELPRGATKYVLGTGGEAFMALTMRPIWRKYHKVAKEQGIKIKMIAYESQRAALEQDVTKEGIYEVRYLPDEIENPSGVHIYPEANTMLNIIYSTTEQPVTAIRIKNPDLVQGQLNLFKNLWKTAKP
ncbi:MAG: helix-turn-helix domain-containing protein [Patescibacteria group bacterium]